MHRVPITAVLLLLLAGAPLVHASAETVLAEWDFAKLGEPDGWQAMHGVAPLEVKGGVLVARSTGSDPYFGVPSLDIATSNSQYIEIEASFGVTGAAQLFYAVGLKGTQRTFDEEHSVRFTVERAGVFELTRLFPNWGSGEVLTSLRLDPPGDEGTGAEVRHVRIVERPIPADLPKTANWAFDNEGEGGACLPLAGVMDLRAENGALTGELPNGKLLITSPPFEAAAADHPFCVIRLAADSATSGAISVRYADVKDFAPVMRVDFPVIADGQARTYNLDLRQMPGYVDTMGLMRLELSGGQPASSFRVEEWRLSAEPAGPPMPMLRQVCGAATVMTESSVQGALCTVTNYGGGDVRGLRLECDEGGKTWSAELPPLPAGQTREALLPVRLAARYEAYTLTVRAVQDGNELGTATCEVVVVSEWSDRAVVRRPTVEAAGDVARIASSLVQMTIARSGAAVLYVADGGKYRRLGSLRSLLAATVAGPSGAERLAFGFDLQKAPGGLTLVGSARDSAGATYRARARVRLAADGEAFDIAAELAAPGKVLAFTAPDCLAGDGAFGRARTVGLFPGLEYLTGAERSSGLDYCAVTVNKRITPHPNKVTVPFMTVVTDDALVELSWDPLQKWDGTRSRPTALFASPNFLSGEANHRMALLAPSVPEFMPENALLAEKPCTGSLSLASTLSLRSQGSVRAAVEAYTARRGLPDLPTPAATYDEAIRAALSAYTGPMWVASVPGWHNALADPWAPAMSGDILFQLWWEQRHQRAAEFAGAVDNAVSVARSKAPPTLLSYYEGDANAGRAALVGASLDPVVRSQRNDGTWPFGPDDSHRVFGRPGDTSTGIVGNNAARLLEYAERTGDAAALRAGLKALEWLDGQLRPEGAQVWELQLHVPDVLASAHCVRAYVAAYKLTGSRHWLDKAVEWANTGVPFIYLWNAEDRPIMRYGSIPVFGASWFTGEWFGRIVQWNGLEYADALLNLAPYDKSTDWSRLAEGIVVSAIQQQRPLDRATSPLRDYLPTMEQTSRVGMYPDSYSAVAGNDSYIWDLSPSAIVRLIYRLRGEAALPETMVVRGPEGRLAHITGPGGILLPELKAGRLTFVADQSSALARWVGIAGIKEPTSIEIDVAGTVARPDDSRWFGDIGLLLVRLEAVERQRVTVSWGE